ncbi:MAG TPA: hypothetical protein VGD25_02220 [Immundisolibacter sp.]
MDTKRLLLIAAGVLAGAGAATAQGGMGMMGDSDAKVTTEQFLERAEARFARMDANKDGVIDASDRQKMRERMRECREMMGSMHMMGGMGDKAGKPAAEHHPAP